MSPLTLTLAGMAVYAVLNARAWRNLREIRNEGRHRCDALLRLC